MKRPEVFLRLGSQKGFTMIEMAMVLIIIGIIVGAVLKGQDVIAGARAKKLASTANAWNVLTFTYMDRLGRFPGDGSRNGIIGDNVAPITEQTAATSAIGQLAAVGAMSSAPENPVVIGGQSYWVFIGSDTLVPPRNAMVICNSAGCATQMSADDLNILQSVDTAIDGTADAGLGQFRGATAVTLVGSGLVNNRATAVVTAVTAVNETTAGATQLWTAAAPKVAAVWLFDKPY